MLNQLIQIFKTKTRQLIFGMNDLEKLVQEKQRVSQLPRFKEGYFKVLGKDFLFHDNLSFLVTFDEIFTHELYKFKPSANNKIIIDCGANIGLSVLFFAINYPSHEIIAFEPDTYLFKLLSINIKNYNLKNVRLIQKAVWNCEGELEFYTDGGMGGRINQIYQNKRSEKVKTIRLKDWLNTEIDFLKIDIEGAEHQVIIDCKDKLNKINNLFFEYHNYINAKQDLHCLLEIIQHNNFQYYLKESAIRKRPFIDEDLICEIFDMAINVFCYRKEETD